MNILVTGGAGYVGSVVAEELLQQGYQVIILDNLQQGHKEAILPGAEFVIADICGAQHLEDVFHRFKIGAVMHMAAETVVEYSMTDPKRYFQNNVVGGLNLLDAMLKHGVYKFVFSSSAAVYGDPKSIPIEEDHPKLPVNSYGESKLMFEHILEWYGRAYGLKYVSLRYFNAAGATELLGEDHRPETHLIPNVLKAALLQPPISNPQPQGLGTRGSGFVSIFGTDYPTKDGSCIRDYVHVIDIAQAHILALQKLNQVEESSVLSPKSGRGCGTSDVGPRTSDIGHRTTGLGWKAGVYNLGNGEGYSVLEVVEAARKVTHAEIPVKISPKRAGDPAVLVASSHRAKEELGWRPKFPQLEAIIESAWKWMRKHPEGYSGV
ncbi:UDP-glucose 4-epimerase [subsurface metagenome]|nr:UDP-glucose 4-epimerase GalE [Dehalococcoidia bacterium]